MTTKICPKCGCTEMSLMHGEDKKLCTGCGTEIEWPLEPGQKSIFKKNVVGESVEETPAAESLSLTSTATESPVQAA